MVIGIAALIAGYMLGDISCGLLGFFDNYNTSIEGTKNNSNDADDKGTSLAEDYFWGHLAILEMATVISGVIGMGGFDYALWALGNKWGDLLP